MTPDEFQQWADVLPDALLLLSGRGEIVAVNRSFRELEIAPASCVGRPLADLVVEPADELNAYLRECRRTREGAIGAVQFRGQTIVSRCVGSLLEPAFEQQPASLLLRIPSAEPTIDRFAVLNEKLDALAHEVERRKEAEHSLRRQRDLATFGRDIGIILAREATLSDMLQRCCESMVRYLDGAFARVWTLDEDGKTLVLKASAGMYTHLDGEHSRIQVGQYKIGQIAAAKRPHLTNSVIGDQRVHDQEWAKAHKMVAFAGYPMVVDERVVGVMALFSQRTLSESSLDAMASVANHVALGIERIRAEDEVRRHAAALQLADRRKDEFLAMLGHELRNPLAPVRSGIELLRLESDGHTETLDLMNDHVQHMTRLVDDLLDVSRIMRGRIKLQRQPVLLDTVITRAVESMRHHLGPQELELNVKRCESKLWVNADPIRVSQVLMNLLNNAVKYTPRGGKLWLETSGDDGQATVRVRDSGVGIDSNFLPQVFELFAQEDRSLDRSAGGLGIGLTLAQRLVELHGGTISVSSEGLGKGSEFVFYLPLCRPPDSIAAEKKSKPPSEANSGYRILVVDDSVGSAKILCRLLSAVGQHKVEMVHDGPSVLPAASSLRPDIIFLDIGLPGLDGYQVARLLRNAPELEDVHLVALTGYGADDARKRSVEAGFDHHLVKPVGLDQIKQILTSTPHRSQTN